MSKIDPPPMHPALAAAVVTNDWNEAIDKLGKNDVLPNHRFPLGQCIEYAVGTRGVAFGVIQAGGDRMEPTEARLSDISRMLDLADSMRVDLGILMLTPGKVERGMVEGRLASTIREFDVTAKRVVYWMR